jgi:uncharacterized protein
MATKTELLGALTAAFTGYEKNDRSALVALLADDFTFEMSDSLPYGGVYTGPAEFVAYWREVAKEWKYFRYDADPFVDGGDSIAVPVRTDALSIHDIVMQNEHLFLFTVVDGLFQTGRLYADTARGRDVLAGHEVQRFPRAQI